MKMNDEEFHLLCSTLIKGLAEVIETQTNFKMKDISLQFSDGEKLQMTELLKIFKEEYDSRMEKHLKFSECSQSRS